MNIYIDIDGTLTDEPLKKWGNPIWERIRRVEYLVNLGYRVVIWSGGGHDYANEWVRKHQLEGVIALGKPDAYIDDNPNIRPEIRHKWIDANDFLEQTFP